MIQTCRIAAAVVHINAAAAYHEAQVFVFHEFDQTRPQKHDQTAVAVVGVGTGAAEFDGLRQNVFLEEVRFYVDDDRKAFEKLGLIIEELEVSTATQIGRASCRERV